MMTVVILCGGEATRLYPLTEQKPKSLIEISGKPFINWQLSLLRKNGVKDVILCIGKFGDQIHDYVKDGQNWGLSVKYSDDGGSLLGTGGALQNAYSVLPEEFIVTNGDSYLDIDYNPVIRRFYTVGHPLLITVYPADRISHPGNIVVKHGRIIAYGKSSERVQANYIDYGLTIMKRWVLNQFPIDEPFDLGDIYSNVIERKVVSCYASPKRFYEVGSVEGIRETENYIRETC